MLIEGQRSTAVKGTKIFKNMSEKESQLEAAIEVSANVRRREKDKIRESTPTSDRGTENQTRGRPATRTGLYSECSLFVYSTVKSFIQSAPRDFLLMY